MSAPENEERTGRSRRRLNIVLYVAALACVAAIGLVASWMWDAYQDDGGDTSGGWWEQVYSVAVDRRADDGATAAGARIGDGRVEALPEASEEEQERTAAVLEAATQMTNAFLNLDHENVESSIQAVQSLSTGSFREQYTKSSESIAKIARRAQSVQTGEVLWAGVVAADDDSATVIVASSGTVSNKTTDFKPRPRNYRIQLELVLADGEWLTRDLQFVA